MGHLAAISMVSRLLLASLSIPLGCKLEVGVVTSGRNAVFDFFVKQHFLQRLHHFIALQGIARGSPTLNGLFKTCSFGS